MDAYEREEEQLERDLEAGLITQAEFNKQLREIQLDYRAAAQQAAWEAHDDELSRWY